MDIMGAGPGFSWAGNWRARMGALTILIAMMKNAGVEKLLSFPVHPAPYERRLFAAWWKIWAKEIFTFSQAQGS